MSHPYNSRCGGITRDIVGNLIFHHSPLGYGSSSPPDFSGSTSGKPGLVSHVVKRQHLALNFTAVVTEEACYKYKTEIRPSGIIPKYLYFNRKSHDIERRGRSHHEQEKQLTNANTEMTQMLALSDTNFEGIKMIQQATTNIFETKRNIEDSAEK